MRRFLNRTIVRHFAHRRAFAPKAANRKIICSLVCDYTINFRRSFLPIARRHRAFKRRLDFILRPRANPGNLFSKSRPILLTFPSLAIRADSCNYFFSFFLFIPRSRRILSYNISAAVYPPPAKAFITHTNFFEYFFQSWASMPTTSLRSIRATFFQPRVYEFHAGDASHGNFFIKSRQRQAFPPLLSRCFLMEFSWHAVCEKFNDYPTAINSQSFCTGELLT